MFGGLCNALGSSGFFGLGSYFPLELIINMSTGQGIAGILMNAKQLLERRNEKKDLQRKSLGASGTTKEKAAEAQYISDLASAALFAAEDTPEYSTQEKCNQ